MDKNIWQMTAENRAYNISRVSAWFYYALLLIAIGSGPSNAQITPSCNQLHLFINTNSSEHTPTCLISSETEHTVQHASSASAGLCGPELFPLKVMLHAQGGTNMLQ